MEQDAFQLLSDLNNFKNFNSEQLKSFIDSGEVVHYKKDDVIIHQGDESDHVFLLISGFLLAEVDYDTSSPVTIGAIYAGEIFGEIAYLEGTKRACSIVTHCDSLVLAFDSNAFENQVESNLILNKLINKSLIERLRRANDNQINSLPNKAIYLTYLSNPNIYQWLLDLLQQQMDKQAIKYLTITDKTLLNKFGENIGTLYFNNWIRELHRVYDCVLFLHTDNPKLTKFYQDNIFRVFIVDDLNEPLEKNVDISGYWQIGIKNFKQKNLLVVHEEKKFLTISENYQYHERVDNLYPIHRNSLENINKIIRFITGKAFGVVLAGGGRKGWVHLGVIKALTQEKIPIDFIGGTSSGSIISSVYTLSEDFKNFEEQVSYLLGENEKVLSFRDFTFPAVAITNSERYTNKLINVFGYKKIEELTGNLFIVACNLTRKEQVVFRNGSIWEAIRASCAIPGIVPPMVIDDDLYVDGGVINNLPTDVMRQILGGQSKIIAVDLSFSTKSPPRFHFPPILGNFDLLKDKLFTKQYKLPSIKNIILRSLLVSSHQTEQQNLALADISIRPSLQGYDLFSSNTENLSELGYSETMRALEKWQDAP